MGTRVNVCNTTNIYKAHTKEKPPPRLVCILRLVLVFVSLVQFCLRRTLSGFSALEVLAPAEELVSLALAASLSVNNRWPSREKKAAVSNWQGYTGRLQRLSWRGLRHSFAALLEACCILGHLPFFHVSLGASNTNIRYKKHEFCF